MVGPDPGETVRLQLLPDRQLVGPGLAQALFCLSDPLRDAQKGLDVMAHLVGDHVGLGEIPGRVETVFQVVVETQVDVHLLVGRTVEGAHRGLAEAARGPDGAPEEHEGWFAVARALGAEEFVPGLLRVREDGLDEHHPFPLLRGFLKRSRLLGRGAHLGAPAKHGAEVAREQAVSADHEKREDHALDPEEFEHHGQEVQDPAPATPAAQRRGAHSPTILDVAAPSSALPAHSAAPRS